MSEEHVGELVRISADAANAIIRGDMTRYLDLIKHAADYTLMPPYGGEPRHGFDASPEALDAMARFFVTGEAEIELAGSYASGDLVVLALVERQHGEVGGLPDQDWSLRVTMVFRRDGPEWRLVHRHADPLVREIGFPRAAELARGG